MCDSFLSPLEIVSLWNQDIIFLFFYLRYIYFGIFFDAKTDITIL